MESICFRDITQQEQTHEYMVVLIVYSTKWGDDVL